MKIKTHAIIIHLLYFNHFSARNQIMPLKRKRQDDKLFIPIEEK